MLSNNTPIFYRIKHGVKLYYEIHGTQYNLDECSIWTDIKNDLSKIYDKDGNKIIFQCSIDDIYSSIGLPEYLFEK